MWVSGNPLEGAAGWLWVSGGVCATRVTSPSSPEAADTSALVLSLQPATMAECEPLSAVLRHGGLVKEDSL